MKKIVIPVLATFLILSMTACSNAALSDASGEQPVGDVENKRSEDNFMNSEEEALMAEEQPESKDDFVDARYEIGDIILVDGSVIKETDLTVIDSSNVPIAVIAGFQEDGTAFGIGVHRSEEPLQWASDGSAGYAISFIDTICTQKTEYDFSGDKDGRNNWEEVCNQDSKDTVDAAENYPAFHFVNTYGASYGLTGDMALGWYMPSIPELCDIYQNREAVNDSLQHIYSLDSQAAMNGLEKNWYWSSSQAGFEDDYAWFVHFFNGYAGECPKNFTNVHALAVRTF